MGGDVVSENGEMLAMPPAAERPWAGVRAAAAAAASAAADTVLRPRPAAALWWLLTAGARRGCTAPAAGLSGATACDAGCASSDTSMSRPRGMTTTPGGTAAAEVGCCSCGCAVARCCRAPPTGVPRGCNCCWR